MGVEQRVNRTEYIGKLNALYVGDKNCLEELITAYDEKDKEIEKLNNNWNKLKEWANEPKVCICHYHILDKMNEIEKRGDKEC